MKVFLFLLRQMLEDGVVRGERTRLMQGQLLSGEALLSLALGLLHVFGHHPSAQED